MWCVFSFRFGGASGLEPVPLVPSVFVLVVALFGLVLGWFLGWFQVGSTFWNWFCGSMEPGKYRGLAAGTNGTGS